MTDFLINADNADKLPTVLSAIIRLMWQGFALLRRQRDGGYTVSFLLNVKFLGKGVGGICRR